MLPRIKIHRGIINTQSKRYQCTADNSIFGFGETPRRAYYDWVMKDTRLVRIPRHGLWNQRSCRARFPWHGRYTKGTNMFVNHGGVMRQIYDYIYETDQLVLRG